MIHLAISIILGLFAYFIHGIELQKDPTTIIILTILATITSAIFFIIGVCVSTCEREKQLKDKEKLVKIDNIISIFREKATVLTEEFKLYLLEYPKIEKEIFDKIKPSNAGMYFVQYPELKSSEVLIQLTKEISSLQGCVYREMENKEGVLAQTRYRPNNPWVLPFFVPKIKHVSSVGLDNSAKPVGPPNEEEDEKLFY